MRQNSKSRLSFILRDREEIQHSKEINSIELGRSFSNDEGVSKELFSAGRDGKVRMFMSEYKKISPTTDGA